MSESSNSIDAVVLRLNKLERQNRHLKRVLVFLLVPLLCAILVGAASVGPRTVVAEKFELKDAQGQLRWSVSTAKDGSIAEWFFDRKGRKRIATSIDKADVAHLAIKDIRGTDRVHLYCFSPETTRKFYRNNAYLVVRGAAGNKSEFVVGTGGPKGGCVQQMSDPNGVIRFNLEMNDNNRSAYLRMYDPKGKIRHFTGTFPDGTAPLYLMDSNGTIRISLVSFANGEAATLLHDQKGKLQYNRNAAADALKATDQILRFLELMERWNR